jgi:ABC-type lipoprotein release transport system permease subunit
MFGGVLGGTIAVALRVQQETRVSIKIGVTVVFLIIYAVGLYDIFIGPALKLRIGIKALLKEVFIIWFFPFILGLVASWFINRS